MPTKHVFVCFLVNFFCCSVTRDDSLLYVNFCLIFFFKFEKQTMNKKKVKCLLHYQTKSMFSASLSHKLLISLSH